MHLDNGDHKPTIQKEQHLFQPRAPISVLGAFFVCGGFAMKPYLCRVRPIFGGLVGSGLAVDRDFFERAHKRCRDDSEKVLYHKERQHLRRLGLRALGLANRQARTTRSKNDETQATERQLGFAM